MVEGYYLFTDGSSINNGKVNCNAKCAYIVFSNQKEQIKKGSRVLNDEMEKNHPYLFNSQCGIMPSNQSAELLGIYFGLRSLIKMNINLKKTQVKIITDSKYSIQVYTEWIKVWEKNNFKTTKGNPVKHVEIIQYTVQLLKRFDNVEFQHVNSHKKPPDKEKYPEEYFRWYGNDLVDKLATLSTN